MTVKPPRWAVNPGMVGQQWKWAWQGQGDRAFYVPDDLPRIHDLANGPAGDIDILDTVNVTQKITPLGTAIANAETGTGACNFDFLGATGTAKGFWHRGIDARSWVFLLTIDNKSAGGQIVFEEGGATTGVTLQYRVTPETFFANARHQNSDTATVDTQINSRGIGETVLVTMTLDHGDFTLWVDDNLEGSASLVTDILDDHVDDPGLFQLVGSYPGSFNNQSPFTLHAFYVFPFALTEANVRQLVSDPFGPIRPAGTLILPIVEIESANVAMLYATADGTISNVVNEVDTTTNLWQSIDDDPASPNDADWINNAGGA